MKVGRLLMEHFLYASDNWVFISEAIVCHFLLHAFILHGLHIDTFSGYIFSGLHSVTFFAHDTMRRFLSSPPNGLLSPFKLMNTGYFVKLKSR